MSDNPEQIPVIIGVGQINDRPETPQAGMDSLGLMVAALREAEKDAGGDLLASLDSLAIIGQISFRDLGDLTEPLAKEIGARPRLSEQSTPHGDSPIKLLNEAANRIGAGEIKIAAIVGGEALRTAAKRAAEASKDDKSVDLMRAAASQREPGYAQSFGLIAPVDTYPLYENAGRAAYGQTLAEGQAETGQIWSAFSEVAADTQSAWIQQPKTPEEIIVPSADNRPLSFPYNKLMVANSSVNQGAAFIVTSLAEAKRRGIAEDRLIYVGMGAASKEYSSPLRREQYDRSISMEISLRKTMELNQLTSDDLDLVELYSCFPCVPKMARRVIGWPADKPATVFGGLTFGGGPIGNYMSHSVACMVDRLRREGTFGLLFANGGIATHNHSIVLSSKPIAAAQFPQDFDYQDEVEAARQDIPALDKDYVGTATVESYTIFYKRDGSPRGGVVMALTQQGLRTLAHVDVSDIQIVAFLTDGAAEPVGTKGQIVLSEGRRIWAL